MRAKMHFANRDDDDGDIVIAGSIAKRLQTREHLPRNHPSMRTATLIVGGVILSLAVIAGSVELEGRWSEDQYKRTGLHSYLYAIGTGLFFRLYMVSTSWDCEQSIYQNGDVFRIHGFKGPHSQVYAHTLTADNATVSLVDLGELGGTLRSTSFVRNDTLVTQLSDQETNEHTITSSRTRTEGSNLMVHELLHVPSGSAVKFYYYKLG